MGQIIIFAFLAISFFTVVLVAVHFQKEEAKRFDEEINHNGWTKVKQNRGFDLLSENEKWRVEFRGSMNTKTQASVIWSHPISSQTPLVILSKMGIGIMDDIPVQGLQMQYSKELGHLTPFSVNTANFMNRYAIYGNPVDQNHPLLTEEIQNIFLSYVGAKIILVVFPDVLQIRLRDRNVKSQIPPMIELGRNIITALNR